MEVEVGHGGRAASRGALTLVELDQLGRAGGDGGAPLALFAQQHLLHLIGQLGAQVDADRRRPVGRHRRQREDVQPHARDVLHLRR